MFITVHRIQIFICSCALFFLSAAPSVVRSQEDTTPVATSTPAESKEIVSDLSHIPYVTEPILGDDIIGDFVVGPGKIDISIAPGQTKVVEMTVTNRTGATRIFEMGAEDTQGSQDPSQALVLLGDTRGPYSLKDYLSVQMPRFELKHNQRARIPVTISVPADAEPGGLYGSMLVSTVTNEAQKGDTPGTVPQSAVVARVGTLFFVTVPGAAKKEGSLREFNTIPKKTFFQTSPINFGFLFENKGSIHLAPYGELRIRNMFDEEVGYVRLDPWFVLPNAVRLREVAWNRDFLFGRYTATVYINRSYDNIVDELSFSFWVLPWKPLLGGFVGLFFIFFIIRSFFKNFEFKRKK